MLEKGKKLLADGKKQEGREVLVRLWHALAREQEAGKNREALAEVERTLAGHYFSECQYAEALTFYLAAAEISELPAAEQIKCAESHLKLGEYDAALALLEGMAKAPRANLLLGQVHLETGKLKEAVTFFETHLKDNPADPEGMVELAAARELAGEAEMAKALYEDVKFDHPDYFQALIDEAHQLHKYKLFAHAKKALQGAEKITKTDPDVFYEIGFCYLDLNCSAEAEASLRESIKLRPSLQAYRELGAVMEKSNQIDKALAFCQVPLRHFPDDPGLNYVLAKCEFRKGNLEAALKQMLPHEDRFDEPLSGAEPQNLVGKIYDKMGKADKAYANFIKAKNSVQASEEFAGLDLAWSFDVTAGYREMDLKNLPSFPPDTAKTRRPAQLVFFVGFPRSGTTLIQQVLQSHKDIQTIDERPTIHALTRILEKTEQGYPQALAGLSPHEAQVLRELYFHQVKSFVPFDENTVLVDKFPLNITHLPLILSLFPEAQVIMAKRHPYAACLSCLMQNFTLNNAMGNLTAPDEITRFYDLVMGFWLEMEKTGALAAHSFKYEDVVADLEAEARNLTAFLGLEWDPAMLEYAQTARDKGIISTPSYAQVVQPIYTDAMEKWRAYEQYFAPYKDRLAPYLAAFGYSG